MRFSLIHSIYIKLFRPIPFSRKYRMGQSTFSRPSYYRPLNFCMTFLEAVGCKTFSLGTPRFAIHSTDQHVYPFTVSSNLSNYTFLTRYKISGNRAINSFVLQLDGGWFWKAHKSTTLSISLSLSTIKTIHDNRLLQTPYTCILPVII